MCHGEAVERSNEEERNGKICRRKSRVEVEKVREAERIFLCLLPLVLHFLSRAAMLRVVAAVVVVAVMTAMAQDWPPAPRSGGAQCSINAEVSSS